MDENELKLSCYFDVIGRESSHSFHCFFDVINNEKYTLHLHSNNLDIINPTTYDIARNSLRPVSGFIRNGNQVYINKKISFIKTNEINSTFGNIIADICYTDKGGRYYAYITPGVYDIEVMIDGKKILNKNQKINDGLKYEYYLLVDGLILRKNKDYIEFCDCEYKNFYGQLIDAKGTPISNSEIIINNGNMICAYVKTDNDGKYKFALKNGKYNVKIRSEYSPVKQQEIIISNNSGFYEQLSNSILFNKKAMLVM